jgi:shikimate kinase
MAYIRKTGVSIFLDIPIPVLAQRIRLHAKDDRPLLSNVEDLEAELQAKYTHRLAYYAQADLRIGKLISAPELIHLLSGHVGPASGN